MLFPLADVGYGQAPRQTVTAMRHRVGLDEAGLRHIPYPGLNGDMLFSNVPGLVSDEPLYPILARIGLSNRSMVAAEMLSSMVRHCAGWESQKIRVYWQVVFTR